MTDARLPRLHRAFDLTPAQARLLLCLYDAGGQVVGFYDILKAASDKPFSVFDGTVTVQVCHIRKAIGRDAIENEWGRGYAITPEGLSKVRSVLEPEGVA